jgi:hypothetical protein
VHEVNAGKHVGGVERVFAVRAENAGERSSRSESMGSASAYLDSIT